MRDEEKVRALERDYTTADLRPRERAILDYAVKLTRRPREMEQTDVETLRRVGLEDGEILDVCQVTGYFAFVNRLADGLGVELEPYWEDGS